MISVKCWLQRANSAGQSLLLLKMPWVLKKAESLCGGRNYLVALESGIPIKDHIWWKAHTFFLGTARSRTKETQMYQMLHIWTKAALWQHQISQCSVWPLAHRGTGPISDQHEKSSYAKQLNWASELNYSVQQYFPVCVCVLRSSLESYSSRSDPAWLITNNIFREWLEWSIIK